MKIRRNEQRNMWINQPMNRSFDHLIIHSFIYWFINLLIYWFIDLLIYWFIHSFIQWIDQNIKWYGNGNTTSEVRKLHELRGLRELHEFMNS
jgi:hypothetical protein